MKIVSLICFVYFVCLRCISGFAHESNEAFFKFTQNKNTIEIDTEFPWTLRNALIKFNPSLEDSTSKKDFINSFISYIKENLILEDKNGEPLKFENLKELENNGHSHQNKYLIVFRGSTIAKITNTIMFNLNDNQTNYNYITVNSTTKTFETTKKISHFSIKGNNSINYWYFLFIPLLYLVYKFANKGITTKT